MRKFSHILFCLWLLVWMGLSPLSCCAGEPSMTMLPKEIISVGLVQVCEQIDLSDYRMTSAELTKVYRELLESEPMLFHVDTVLVYEYGNDGYVTRLRPQYRMSKADYDTALAELKPYLDLTVQSMPETFGEADKALYIHDHLAANYLYSPEGFEQYDIYTLWRDGHGVCQAFSLMYVALGRRAGLDVDMVVSSAMDHAWNHVGIDEAFFHVDVTRDLSTSGEPFSHQRFLLSDAAIKSIGYHDFACHNNHLCEDHRFEEEDSLGGFTGVLSQVKGSSLYVGHGWMILLEDQTLRQLKLFDKEIAESPLTNTIDIDGDGLLSLKDLLCDVIQNADGDTKEITDRIRLKLLEEAITATVSNGLPLQESVPCLPFEG